MPVRLTFISLEIGLTWSCKMQRTKWSYNTKKLGASFDWEVKDPTFACTWGTATFAYMIFQHSVTELPSTSLFEAAFKQSLFSVVGLPSDRLCLPCNSQNASLIGLWGQHRINRVQHAYDSRLSCRESLSLADRGRGLIGDQDR